MYLWLRYVRPAAQTYYPFQVDKKFVKATTKAHLFVQFFSCRIDRKLNIPDPCGRIEFVDRGCQELSVS